MRTKFIASFAAIALLFSPLSSYGAGRRMISSKTAQQGFQVPVSPQGVAITIPGEQITFIQLSHLSNFVCTTDNGNMCVSGSGTANLIYLRRIQLSQQFPGQIASSDGSTLLLLKANGGACSALCPITLVPSSSVPKFNIVEIGVDPPQLPKPFTLARSLPPRAIAPVPVPSPAPLPTVEVDLPQNFKNLEEVPPPPSVKEKSPSPVAKVDAPKPQSKPSPRTRKLTRTGGKKPQPKNLTKKTSTITQVSQAKSSEMSSRVLANKVVLGLAIANRTKEIPYYSSKSFKVQDLVRILRRDRSLAEAMQKSGVIERDVNRLIQLGTKNND